MNQAIKDINLCRIQKLKIFIPASHVQACVYMYIFIHTCSSVYLPLAAEKATPL